MSRCAARGSLGRVARVVQTYRLDLSRWSRRLRAIYDVAPGQVGAWTTLFLLQNQATWLRNLRSTVTMASIQHALVQWDVELSQYEERLKRYRHDLVFARDVDPETIEDNIEEFRATQIDTYFVAPVFRGDYSAFLDEDEDDTQWAFFVDPGHPDVMTGTMLWNQVFEVLRVQEELEPSTWEFLGCATAAPVPLVNLIACAPVLAWAVGDWAIDAEKQMSAALPGEPQTLRDRMVAAVEEFARTSEDLLARAAKAATKLSWVLYLAGGLLFFKAGTAMYRRSRARRALGS